jgi:hypothetical protein
MINTVIQREFTTLDKILDTFDEFFLLLLTFCLFGLPLLGLKRYDTSARYRNSNTIFKF